MGAIGDDMDEYLKNGPARKFGVGMKLRIAILTLGGLAVSGCYPEYGPEYAGYDGYECDPYDQFDSYYDCEYGYGFSNIGYGGGWYDNYYYPGYGIYLFDSYGHRHNMHNHHRRYWAGRRHDWQRNHGGTRHHGRRGGGYAGHHDDDHDRDGVANRQRPGEARYAPVVGGEERGARGGNGGRGDDSRGDGARRGGRNNGQSANADSEARREGLRRGGGGNPLRHINRNKYNRPNTAVEPAVVPPAGRPPSNRLPNISRPVTPRQPAVTVPPKTPNATVPNPVRPNAQPAKPRVKTGAAHRARQEIRKGRVPK